MAIGFDPYQHLQGGASYLAKLVYKQQNVWFDARYTYNVCPPQVCLLVYKAHEYYSYRYHKP